MKKGPIIAISSAVVLTTLLAIAPRTPSSEAVAEQRQQEHEHGEEMTELDAKVARAVEIIQSGEGSPMQGVILLREVIEEDPQHIGALMWLGEFSIMSGQLDKAEGRYLTVLGIEPDNYVALERLLLIYGQNENIQGEIEVIQAFLRNNESTTNRALLEERLAEIQENKLNN